MTVSLRSVNVCRAAISSVHKVPHMARNVMADEAHPLHHRTVKYYEAIINKTIDREKEGLWVIVGANHLSRKRTVRSWARRRILHAVSQQLGVRGFDTKGRRLKGATEESDHHDHKNRSLIGIVDIQVDESSINCKYEEILRQVEILVQEILARCGSSSQGSNG